MEIDKILRDYYQGKKVFLTGHTGFKGSWLLLWLKELGAEVMGYSLSPKTEDDLYLKMNGDKYCSSIIGDIRDKEKLNKKILEFQPDYIFHLAAQPLVRLSYKLPVYTFSVNVMGTCNLLDSIQQLNKNCQTVIVTTDKVYENCEWYYPYRENDRLGGYDPYSTSKACTELVTNSFRNSFFNEKEITSHGKAIATARAGNVIGGGDWAKDRIVPDIIRSLQQEKPIPIRNPIAVRPWQHVIEPIAGYLLLGVKLKEMPRVAIGSWNFGPYSEEHMTVKELVQIAISAWGNGSFYTPDNIESPHEAGLLKLDITKAMNQLNWRPKWNAEYTIQKTINWYKNLWESRATSKELMLENLHDYLSN